MHPSRYPRLLFIAAFSAAGAFAQDGTWTDVFNGTDLTGLKKHGNGTVTVMAADKIIDVNGGNGYLYTEADYSWYRARVEWKNLGHGNSGYLHHIDLNKHACGDWPSGPELQMMEGDVGSIWTTDCKFNTTGSGLNYNPAGAALTGIGQYGCGRTHFVTNGAGQEKKGDWNTWEIFVKGDSLEARVNGTSVMRISKLKMGGDIAMAKGKMGLQIEGSHVQWRNWQVMDLSQATAIVPRGPRSAASRATMRAPGEAAGIRFTREGFPSDRQGTIFTATGRMTLAVPAP